MARGWGADEEIIEFWISFVLDDWRERDRVIHASWETWYGNPRWDGPVPDLADLDLP